MKNEFTVNNFEKLNFFKNSPIKKLRQEGGKEVNGLIFTLSCPDAGGILKTKTGRFKKWH